MMINKDPMTRSPQGRSRRRKPNAADAKPSAVSDKTLPPRRVKHPSNKQQMASWFYNTLIVLFLVLAAGLFFFGKQLTGQD